MEDYLSRLGESVTIRAVSNGIPVYGFGYSYVYGVCPDFVEGVKLQEGNSLPAPKIRPKKSWEIRENKLGATPPREPRTASADKVPLLDINLIDGDPETYWSSRPQNQPDVEPAWIRIDLAVESQIGAVVIVPREDRLGMPGDITIKVSRDAWHWDTVYSNKHYDAPVEGRPHVFSFAPRPVKQIWIVGSNLSSMPPPRITYAFSVAEVQVLDAEGRNIALISRGAGVTVSSCDFGLTSPREKHTMLWSTHLDLGLKWVRVAYAAPSPLNWNFVERRKGTYEVDESAEEAIDQLTHNGVNVVLCLAFTNWLYTPQGRQDPKWTKQIQESSETNGPGLPSASVPGMLEGYKNFVRYMVRHFKDRVKYYEIWNEPPTYGGMDGDAGLYAKYFREAASVIREEFPGAKIVLGSVGNWDTGDSIRRLKRWLANDGLAGLADVLGWHPCYGCDPLGPDYQNYPAVVRDLKQFAAAQGFRGEYMATEWLMTAPYPVSPLAKGYPPALQSSEMIKAKHALRYAIMSVALDVYAFWNETWADYNISWDCGLFRNTFSSYPISPSQPQPVYYALRTLSTLLEGVSPINLPVQFSVDRGLEYFGFKQTDGTRMLAVWLAGRSKDVSEEVKVDISLGGLEFHGAEGVDTLNGTTHELVVSKEGGATTLKGIMLKDYPVVIKFLQHQDHE